ncbi:hypothetical protein CICLE_v10008276mg [Citrus x clementina]|uniref:poly(A)-specific ribonuclease n=2 Tax=Citrus TaxID=2706 RepID=V4WB05_CITCL|nr:hypothetical protein CICLE_v10008276mg [Citrus x clementina]
MEINMYFSLSGRRFRYVTLLRPPDSKANFKMKKRQGNGFKTKPSGYLLFSLLSQFVDLKIFLRKNTKSLKICSLRVLISSIQGQILFIHSSHSLHFTCFLRVSKNLIFFPCLLTDLLRSVETVTFLPAERTQFRFLRFRVTYDLFTDLGVLVSILLVGIVVVVVFSLGLKFAVLEMSVLPKGGDEIQIREVWNDNLEEEFALIREIVDKYNYIAMDTEFPGVVLRPVGAFKNINDYNYQTLKDNVDMLKLIQLGLTFSDENGNLPTCGTDKFCIWQFNFREFNLIDDIFASDSVELLHQCGIDFKKNNEKGIDVNRFGELLMSSGIVLNDVVRWVTFHSGYDFGYLLKLLTCRSLPDTQAGFFELINMYFPVVYDIKHLMKFCNSLHGGLNKLAELLEVERVGICHQAGSDSLLTSCTFRKLRENFFNGCTEKYAGVLYGLGVENDKTN